MVSKAEVIASIDKNELKSVLSIAITIARNAYIRNNLNFIKAKFDLIGVKLYSLIGDIDENIQRNFEDIYDKLKTLSGVNNCFNLTNSSICVACSFKGKNLNAYPANMVNSGLLYVPLSNNPCIIATEKELTDFCLKNKYDINTTPPQIIAEDFIKTELNNNH